MHLFNRGLARSPTNDFSEARRLGTRRGTRPCGRVWPRWRALSNACPYRDLSRSGFARSVKEHRRFVYSPRSCRLEGLAFKRTQGQTDTRHYRIPSTLFFLRIGKIKAVNRAEGTARKIAAAVKNNSISLRGYSEERPGYPHIVQRSAVHAQIVPQVTCRVLCLIVRARVNR
jgi:hypothetical protein